MQPNADDPDSFMDFSNIPQARMGAAGKGVKEVSDNAVGSVVLAATTFRYGSKGAAPTATSQANHIFQDKAFSALISRADGEALWLEGQAAVKGTPHYNFHAALEAFWGPYRAAGTNPTIGQYMTATYRGLRAAGLSAGDATIALAKGWAAIVRRNPTIQLTDAVPYVPGRLPGH
jgi:hypothetical protein